MSIKERVTQELERLSEEELEQVADYMEFLKFRTRRHKTPHFDPEQLAALYA